MVQMWQINSTIGNSSVLSVSAVASSRLEQYPEGGGGGIQHLGLWSTLAPGWLCLLMPGLSKALLVQPVCEISIPAGRQLDKIPDDDDDFQRKWKLFR